MKTKWKIVVTLVLVAAIAAVLTSKKTGMKENIGNEPTAIEETQSKRLPQLVDLGADKCIPCKMMAPILDELREKYKGRLHVTFIDVWKDPAPGRQYGIRAIPTQIFLDPAGEELFRHEGFFSKEDILAKWRELGYTLED